MDPLAILCPGHSPDEALVIGNQVDIFEFG
jgi:hypothetical protein